MTDEEICREYRLAKYPGKQVKILAEENGCSMGTIYNILRANGVQFKSDRTASKKGDDSNMETKTSPGKEPAAPAQEPPWSPLPAAPPQAAADFDETAPKQRDKAPKETAEAAVARSIKEASRPLLSAQTHFPREPWPLASSEDSAGAGVMPDAPAAAGTEERIATAPAGPRNDVAGEERAAPEREAKYVRDWRPLLRTLSDKVLATCIHSPESGAEPAEAGESGNVYRISGADVSRMWHILGRLQGVLEASAEAGRPGEVMKDACDELEVILCGIQQDAG